MDRLQIAVARAKERKKELSAESELLRKDKTFLENQGVSKPVSEEQLARGKVVAGLEGSQESDSFRLLRTKVLSEMKVNGWKSIAVTSPSAGQGKSTIAANLAVAMSMEMTHSVLLVDLDLERPNLHRVFGLEPDVGMSDLLLKRAEPKDVLLDLGIDRLTVLLGGEALANSSEWISGPDMQRYLSELRSSQSSRYIVYDMPAILRSDDVLKSIKNFDCFLLVLEDGCSTAGEIQQSLDIMRKTNFLGYVLNRDKGISSRAAS